ncbi:hypothetical protein BCV70DRAFT_197337 [Testicularia cyperi]|uniref:Pentacotripeptide-repeat region of PRORP domain-containing protein n=1 Tax=Testicularia cyperi TaxID=1882483 RepID=A0A317XXW0_9BASI|nr:hypothetical protein BCV70DRAFT_197337 [Testicularia cyperi]
MADRITGLGRTLFRSTSTADSVARGAARSLGGASSGPSTLLTCVGPSTPSYRSDHSLALAPAHTRTFATSSHPSFQTTTTTHVSAHRKQAGREKARMRQIRQEERVIRRREKDGYRPRQSSKDPASEGSGRSRKSEEEEEVEATIREYMARTGPTGERLTLSQQEQQLRQELNSLGKELEVLEQKAKAKEATKDLPELDDQTLDELYQALMLPPPPTGEDSRLARLEGGRREKALLATADRGRRQPERLHALSASPTPAEERRLRASRDLKQKLIQARERGRMLLPPSTPRRRADESSPVAANLQQAEPVEEDVNDAGLVDLAALPHAERQEVRLQQLFARLAIVQSSEVPEHGQEPLHDVRTGLAARIARILESHDYRLASSLNKESRSTTAEDVSTSDSVEEPLPDFEPLRLDQKAYKLAALDSAMPPTGITLESSVTARSQPTSDVLVRAESMLQDLSSPDSRSFMLDGIERLLRSANPSKAELETAPSSEKVSKPLPLGVASVEEWTALAVSSANAADAESLARTFSLMERSGYFPPPLSLYNDVMDVCATRGDVGRCQELLASVSAAGLVPDDHTYHSLVKAYATASQFSQAIELLNSLEVQGRPASMATYTLVIDRLFDPVDSGDGQTTNTGERPELQALAWNVFYHMRLVAHPVPDAPLYALMIRACAKGLPQPQDIDDPTKSYTSLEASSSSSGANNASGNDSDVLGPARISEAERALDLFREMTTRYGVRPNAEVYNNLILACARRKDFYLEAFRLLREMVELETERAGLPDDSGVLHFAPDRYTFNALLQGCARNRDLPRARWVLAEMIRTTTPLFDSSIAPALLRTQKLEMLAKRPSEETLSHIFHTYASYTPPVKRVAMKIKSDEAVSAQQSNKDTTLSAGQSSAIAVAEDARDAQSKSTVMTAQPSTSELETVEQREETTAEEAAQIFSALVPQTSSDLVSEARSLFARVLADQPSSEGVEGPLGAVRPGIRLVNSYLTILAAHLPSSIRHRVLLSTLDCLNSASTEVTTDTSAESVFRFDPSQTLEEGLFSKLGIRPNEHTYRILLQALSELPVSSSEQLGEAVDAVNQVWSRFQGLLQPPSSSTSTAKTEPLEATQIKRCWTNYMHFWSKNCEIPSSIHAIPATDRSGGTEQVGLDIALSTLKQFAALYPPRIVASKEKSKAKEPRRSQDAGPGETAQIRFGDAQQRDDSRLSGRATKPKAKANLPQLDLSPLPVAQKSLETLAFLADRSRTSMNSKTNVGGAESTTGESGSEGAEGKQTVLPTAPSDSPATLKGTPSLTFLDVQLLHHRLVRYNRIKDLAYLSWLLRRYSAAATARRGRAA